MVNNLSIIKSVKLVLLLALLSCSNKKKAEQNLTFNTCLNNPSYSKRQMQKDERKIFINFLLIDSTNHYPLCLLEQNTNQIYCSVNNAKREKVIHQIKSKYNILDQYKSESGFTFLLKKDQHYISTFLRFEEKTNTTFIAQQILPDNYDNKYIPDNIFTDCSL